MKKFENSILEKEIEQELELERKEHCKVYLMKNGRRMMTISREPIHYWDEKNQRYEEIDSQLKSSSNGISVSKGDYRISLPNGKKNTRKVKIKKGTHSIEWEYLGMNENTTGTKELTTPHVDYIGENPAFVKKDPGSRRGKHSLVQYTGIEDGIDLEYEVMNDRLKENIIIRSLKPSYSFFFVLRTKGVTAVLSEDKKNIDFYEKGDKGKEPFRIPVPFMVDAAGEKSYAVTYQLTQVSENEYRLGILADADWINAKDRTLPIVIDPEVEYSNSISECVSYQNSKEGIDGIGIGFSDYEYWYSTISANISLIPSFVNVTDAILTAVPKEMTGDENFWVVVSETGECRYPVYNGGGYAVDVSNAVSIAHQAQQSTCSFSLLPSAIFQISEASAETASMYSLMRTEKATALSARSTSVSPLCDCGDSDYDTGSDNSGNTGSSSGNGSNYCPEDDCDNDTNIPIASVVLDPYYTVLYVVYSGSEEYSDNQSIMEIASEDSVDAGVNLYSGELSFKLEDVSTGSVAFPLTISHYFDKKNWSTSTPYGKGWSTSLDQRIEMLSGGNLDHAYFDGNGKKHIFVIDDNDESTDLSGLNLTMSHSGGTTITDRNGNVLHFNSSGLLHKISDANGNYVTITRTLGVISEVTDNFGRKITMTYSNNKLESMTDPAGRITSYSYNTSGTLSAVTYPDGSVTEITYDGKNRIEQVRQRDNTKLFVQYAQYRDRVVHTALYPVGSNPATDTTAEYVNFDYRTSRSTAVSDRTGISKVFVFDETGRAELQYEEAPLTVNGIEIKDRTSATGTTIYSYTEKKRTFGTSIRTADESNNMITNGSFENGTSAWELVGGEDTDGVVNDDSSDQMSAYCIHGSSRKNKYLKQTIEAENVKLQYGNTLILSAWAKANSMTGDAKFHLRAEVHYTDNTTVTKEVGFDTEYDHWQYAALPLRINLNNTLEYITVYLDYSKNSGTCLFDNIRLVNAPSQEVEYQKNLNGIRTVFGKDEIIKERVTSYNGIYTTVSEKNENYDVVRTIVTDKDGNSFVSVASYDDAHRVVRSQNERNIVTEYTYNSCGMATSTKTYYLEEFNPNLVDNAPAPTEYFKQEMTYDETGEFLITQGDNRSADIKTTNSYNKTKGLLMSTSTPNGQATNYTYDNNTDLVTGVSANVNGVEYSVLYGYNNRKLTSITHKGFDYSFTYDDMGRTKKLRIAGNDYTENSYTLGETTTVATSYASGETMIVETDLHNQPVKRTYVDSNGNSTVIAEGEYDSLGKPITVIDNAGYGRYNYTYDGYENVTDEYLNGNLYKTHSYDDHARLRDNFYDTWCLKETYTNHYDTRDSDGAIYPDNAVVGTTLCDVFTQENQRDVYGRTVRRGLTHANGTELLSDDIEYLSVESGSEKRLTNMVETLVHNVKGDFKKCLQYTYDNNGNITSVSCCTTVIATYSYDGMNQLVREDNALLGRTYVFTYDTAGNILSKKEYPYTTGTLVTPLSTKSYTYSSTGWKDRLTSFDGKAITYDALGNPIQYRGRRLTWGKLRQLERYDTFNFAYNASGIRIQKNNISYEVDGNRILSEVNSMYGISYFYDTTGVCGFLYDNKQYFYEKNLQGDITAVYDNEGNLKAEYVYDAWGNHTITVNVDNIAAINPFRYRGYYYDTETGLYYLNSRYYDPETGRFITPDATDTLTATPTELTDKNLYAYCDNNPVVRVDNGGEFWNVIIGAGVGAVVGLAGQFVSDLVTSALNREWTFSNWQTYTGAIVGGAVGGAILGGTGSVSLANLASGYVTTGVGMSLEKVTGVSDKSWMEIRANAVADGVISYGLGMLPGVKNVTKGINSMSAVYKSGLTKLRNGTVSYMSKKVIAKGVASNFVGSLAMDTYYGVKQFLYTPVRNEVLKYTR